MFDKYKANDITRTYMEKYADLRFLLKHRNSRIELTKESMYVNAVLNIYIEPTNRCNLNCIFCARENMKRDFHMLDFDVFKKTVDSLPSGTYLTLTGNGEPTLNVRIYDMIAYAAQRGMFVSMITNGCTLTQANRKKLIDSGISRIQISFQALDKEAEESIMRGTVYERELLHILQLIYEIRQSEKNIFISIAKVDVEESRDFAALTKEFWEKMPVDNYYEGKYLSLQTDSPKYEKQVERDEYLPCVDPWIVAKVNANGDVNLCPQDFSNKYVIGNINEESLIDILNSKKAEDFRLASLTGDMDFLDAVGYCCGDCNTWHKGMGNNIEEFIQCSLPVRLGLVLDEINGTRPSDTEFLQKAITMLKSGDMNMSAILREDCD